MATSTATRMTGLLASERARRRERLLGAVTGAGKGLGMGFILWIPLFITVRIAVIETARDLPIFRAHYAFEALATSDQGLQEWISKQPDVEDVFIGRRGRMLHVQYRAPKALHPDWAVLGYQGLYEVKINHDVVSNFFDPSILVYIFLLARMADFGFFVVSIRRLRRARQAGELIPNLFMGRPKRAFALGIAAGIGIALLLLGWEAILRGHDLGPTAAARFWTIIPDLPAVAWILVLLTFGFLQPLGEEPYFRGVVFGSFLGEQKPWVGVLLAAALSGISQLDPASIPVWFVIGIILCMIYRAAGSLFAPLTASLIGVFLPALVFATGIAPDWLVSS